MTKLEEKLRGNLRQLGIGAGSSVVAAVSGGADSTALLDALVRLRDLKKYPDEIFAAHLNHRLRGEESDQDEQFVRRLAGRFDLKIFVEQVNAADVARGEKRNLEATARRLRYDFLWRVAAKCNAEFILTAHTRDDQVETILMRLLRGSGPQGLRGIHRVVLFDEKVKLARPLLSVTREEVLSHCEFYGIDFRVDSSNLEHDFTRNRIRRELLPLLRTFNPGSNDALIRFAELVAEDEDFLREVSSELLAKAERDSALEIEQMVPAHTAIRRRALRMWLKNVGQDLRQIDASHIAATERLMTRGQSGQTVELPGRWRVVREFNRLILIPPTLISIDSGQSYRFETVSLKTGSVCEFGGYRFTLVRGVSHENEQMINTQESGQYTALLRECDEMNRLRIRARAPGDGYTPVGRNHRIKLKTLMIRHKIPVSRRNHYPVLVTEDDQIVWAPGLPVSRDFFCRGQQGLETKCVLVIAQKTGNA